MKVARWGNSLAVRIPADVAAALDLKVGDEVVLQPDHPGALRIARAQDRLALLEKLRVFRGRLPENWKFDRDDANAR
jgi:antitoxin MazE